MPRPTHKEFQEAIKTEREYVFAKHAQAVADLDKATTALDYWKRQADAISAVSSRVSMGDDSAFKEAK